MTTKLTRPLKREVTVNNTPYTLTISEQGLKLVPKGKRAGAEMTWEALLTLALVEELKKKRNPSHPREVG